MMIIIVINVTGVVRYGTVSTSNKEPYKYGMQVIILEQRTRRRHMR